MDSRAQDQPTEPDEAHHATLAAKIGALRPAPDAIAKTFEHELVRHELERALFGGDARAEKQPSIDRYPLERKIGEGAMGSVYVGRDERLGRAVAIKLLRGATTTQARARLEREAMSLARLSHPNVVQIYEFGEVEDVPFMVMELVEGVTMRTWLDAAHRSLEDIVRVYLEAGKGLAAAHKRGIVHRDFKPDNVMVEREGRVIVMDFGLAAPEGLARGQAQSPEGVSAELGDVELTTTGTILGTPAYMAPEQFLGEPSDARADQFAFCVSLWEALYGERPFSGINVAALSSAVIGGERVSPRRSGVPRRIRRALERGLEREPDQRWPSMEALLDALAHDSRRRGRARSWLLAASCAALCVGGALTMAELELESEQAAVQDRNEVVQVEQVEQTEDVDLSAATVTPPAAGTMASLVLGFGCKELDAQAQAEGKELPFISDCELLRSAADKLGRDPKTLASLAYGARIVPAMRDGDVRGYKLYVVRNDSLWAMLGFQNGDMIVSLNGERPEPGVPSRLLEPGTETIEVELERKGERMRARVRLVDTLSVESLRPEQLRQLDASERAQARSLAASTAVAELGPETEAERAEIASRMGVILGMTECEQTAAGRRCVVAQAGFDQLVDAPELLAREARVVPAVREGETAGFKLFGIRSGSLLDTFGLKNGDLVESVNGESLTSLEVAMRAYYDIRGGKALALQVVRKGEPWTLELRVES